MASVHPANMRLIVVKLKSSRKPAKLAGHGYEVNPHGYLRVWVRLVSDKTRDNFNAYPGCWEWVQDEGQLE